MLGNAHGYRRDGIVAQEECCCAARNDFMLHYGAADAVTAPDTTAGRRYGEIDETYPRGS